MAVVNAWVVYKEATKTKLQISDFRKRLDAQLLNSRDVGYVTLMGFSSSHHLLEQTGCHKKEFKKHVRFVMPKKERSSSAKRKRHDTKFIHIL